MLAYKNEEYKKEKHKINKAVIKALLYMSMYIFLVCLVQYFNLSANIDAGLKFVVKQLFFLALGFFLFNIAREMISLSLKSVVITTIIFSFIIFGILFIASQDIASNYLYMFIVDNFSYCILILGELMGILILKFCERL